MLIEKIKNDQITARKAHDRDLATLLTTLYSEAAMIGKNDGNRITTDAETISTIKKFIKNAEEVIEILDEDKTDLRYHDILSDIKAWRSYLPQQLTADDIKTAVGEIIQSHNLSSPKDMGIVMKELKSAFDGRYDGKLASQITKELLS